MQIIWCYYIHVKLVLVDLVVLLVHMMYGICVHCPSFLRIIPRTWLPLDAAILHCSETFMLAFIDIPKSFFLHSFT